MGPNRLWLTVYESYTLANNENHFNFLFYYLFKVYRHEFIELKKLLELKQEYDFDNNNGKNSMRGISWEVRKTSPGPRKHSTDGINETKIR